MAKNKFSKMYMLEVKGNKTSEQAIDFLVNNLITTITKVYPSSKAGVVSMDRER